MRRYRRYRFIYCPYPFRVGPRNWYRQGKVFPVSLPSPFVLNKTKKVKKTQFFWGRFGQILINNGQFNLTLACGTFTIGKEAGKSTKEMFSNGSKYRENKAFLTPTFTPSILSLEITKQKTPPNFRFFLS